MVLTQLDVAHSVVSADQRLGHVVFSVLSRTLVQVVVGAGLALATSLASAAAKSLQAALAFVSQQSRHQDDECEVDRGSHWVVEAVLLVKSQVVSRHARQCRQGFGARLLA